MFFASKYIEHPKIKLLNDKTMLVEDENEFSRLLFVNMRTKINVNVYVFSNNCSWRLVLDKQNYRLTVDNIQNSVHCPLMQNL